MDADRFDRIAKALGTRATRRSALGLVAGLGSLLGLGEAAAGTRLGGARCAEDRQCQTNKCLANGTCSCRNRDPSVACERTGEVCRGGECCTRCGDNCCVRGEFCADAATSACRIKAGSCRRGDDICAANAPIPCGPFGGPVNADCACFESMAGPTRCGASQAGCGVCTTNAECEVRLGVPGAFCIRDTGPGCLCAQGEGFCAAPCPG